MKDVIFGKVYDTKNAYLVKEKWSIEDLSNGYTRYTAVKLYFRERSHDYFVHVRKVATDERSKVIDDAEHIRPVTDEYAKGFNRQTDLFLL